MTAIWQTLLGPEEINREEQNGYRLCPYLAYHLWQRHAYNTYFQIIINPKCTKYSDSTDGMKKPHFVMLLFLPDSKSWLYHSLSSFNTIPPLWALIVNSFSRIRAWTSTSWMFLPWAISTRITLVPAFWGQLLSQARSTGASLQYSRNLSATKKFKGNWV